MLDGCENSKSTVVFSTSWQERGMGECVSVGGWPATFITCMGGVRRLGTGESVTTVYAVFAESVTHLGMKGNEDEV